MTDNTQPEALRLAQELDEVPETGGDPDSIQECAAELLRLHAENEALRTQQPAPATQQAVGNSGYDHQTAADFLSGKTISNEAVRKFVQASRWAHDEKAALSAMLLSVRGVLASREAEIALLKKALLEAETAPQPSPTAQAAESVGRDAERERICAAIKAEDDYCVDQGDYMLDSNDCIKIVRGEWVRPDFSVAANGGNK